MLVRVNFGWKAGKVQDIEPVAAREMLADGRASAINYDGETEPENSVPIAETKAPKPAKRNR